MTETALSAESARDVLASALPQIVEAWDAGDIDNVGAADLILATLDAARSQPVTEIDVERLADAIEDYVRSAKGDPSPWARNAEDIATDLAAEYARVAATEPAGDGVGVELGSRDA